MWPVEDRPSHSQEACAELLHRFLLDPGELLEALAPGGWERSPLLRIFHPTAEQLRAERESMRRNLAALSGRPEPAVEEEAEAEEAVAEAEPNGATGDAIAPEREIVDLLGRALWDVFSQNHAVIDAGGREFNLGSFRGSAGFIADSLNRRYAGLGVGYDYLDFYMGTTLGADRADLRPLYRWIFARLKEAGCRWIYSFPRLYLVDFGCRPRFDDWSSYDPSEAVKAELEEAERAKELETLADKLQRWYEDDVRRARHEPLPAIVAAYREVFGGLPEGWPHPDM
ncbi:MAG: hypothetical protein HY703_13885 [Gemmatimonadetes bacterium]|nr:hypothetical protein [Gemmatimonadota bacterium]